MIKKHISTANVDDKVTFCAAFTALTLIFCFTHGWVLLSFDALYWDDWSILTSSATEIRRLFHFVGFELAGVFHAWLAPFGPGAYKILMLVSLALMSACVFFIAENYDFNRTHACWITALFIVAPFNTSKIAAVNVAAVMFASIFFLAWVLLLRDLKNPSLLQRVCVLALFIVAFYLPSSLAFFALPAMSIAWHAYRSADRWRQRLGAFFSRADFLLLPFIQFAIFRIFFFKPHASIANEYQKFGIRTSRLQEAWERIQTDILLDMPWAVKIILLALPLLILLRFAKRPLAQKNAAIRNADFWMLISLCACFFALLPYLAVGRLPVFSDWNSRYHLFLPLSFAIVCWSIGQYAAAYVQSKWFGVAIYVLILVLSTGFTVRSYFEYAEDWQKQNQLMQAFRAQRFINPTDNIVLVDSVVYAKRRSLRYYEYTSMLRHVQPEWNGIALSYAQLQSVGGGSLESYMDLLGGIDNIQADPRPFGLSSKWRWNDNCVVLVAFEMEGRVQLRRAIGQVTAQQPCLLPPLQTY